MALQTVNNLRVRSLTRRIERLDADPGRLEAVALGLVDALLDGDGESLAAGLDALRDARARADGDLELAGRLDAAIAFAHWGLERVPSDAGPAPGTQAYAFLRALAGPGRTGSSELRRLLEVDETQVSRTGRRLLDDGLVARSKAGRQVFWQLTPRGRRALEEAAGPARSATSAFWQDALRRGFEAAAGRGEPREVDATRERIVASALDLHTGQGIQATTMPEVAAKAGVPLETVERMFPTLDDLARGCGEHLMESLQLPPEDEVPKLFVRDRSERQRIHRLVETCFAAYERGADGITAGRREAKDVPAVRESIDALDHALDAVVVEALRLHPVDGAAVASLRALTDLEVWRALRHQGATPEAAVDRASAAVERWLEARAA